MILDSFPWKDGLLRDAVTLRSWSEKRRSAKRSFAIEETVFVAAFKIRRLIESGKVSSSLASLNLPADFYRCKLKGINKHTRYDIENYYDFSAPAKVALSIGDVVNKIIHSFVFGETVRYARAPRKKFHPTPSCVSGFIFNSDRSRDTGLWYVSLNSYIDVLNAFGNDDPQKYIGIFNPKTGDWDTWAGNGDPPVEFAAKAVASVTP